jgi:hypothetical protein
MKIVLYQCDWCGEKRAPRHSEDWPDGWSNLDELGNEDLLCVQCMQLARGAIRQALEDCKARRSPQAPTEEK